MAPDGEIHYQAVYLGYKDELESFTKQENDEMPAVVTERENMFKAVIFDIGQTLVD